MPLSLLHRFQSSDPHLLLCVCCKRIRNHVFHMNFFSPIFFFNTSTFSVAIVKIHTRTGNYFATYVENQGS